MENKYYIPDISEFYPGFEYELQLISIDITDIQGKHYDDVISKIER